MKASMSFRQHQALLDFTFALVGSLRSCVAGGFAAGYEQASDVDLWMFNDPMLEATVDYLDQHGVKWTQGKTSETVQSIDATSDEGAHATALIRTPLIPIHVVGTRAQNIDQLLASFDISTHRWAYTSTGVLVEGPGATSIYEPGRVLLYKFRNSTDERVKKLSKRYDIEIAEYVEPKKLVA